MTTVPDGQVTSSSQALELPKGAASLIDSIRGPFERLVGRPPTDEENKQMLARLDLVKTVDMSFVLVAYIANVQAQESLNRVPAEVRAIVDETRGRLASVTVGLDVAVAKAVGDVLRSQIAAIVKAQTARPSGHRWRWPLQAAVGAVALLVMGVVSLAGAVGQRNFDARVCSRLGAAALPHVHLPWVASAMAVVARVPGPPVLVMLAGALVVIGLLGVRKSGPPTVRVWPP